MVSFDLRDSVAIIRLNRPEKLNALTGAMLLELGRMFERIRRVANIHAVILTGAGERAFSVGADIAEFAAIDAEGAEAVASRGREVCALVEGCGVPVIAAVNGLAAGWGCELALACHIRIASTEARFSLPEVNLGVISADGGSPERPARVAGGGRAFELMLTDTGMSADEALRLGLANRVVTPKNLLDEAESLAREISRLAPLAIRACLAAVTGGLDLSLAEGLELETELFSSLFSTEDMREGTLAFLEKRAPVFKGK